MIFFTLDNYKLHITDKQLFNNKQKRIFLFFKNLKALKKGRRPL